MRDTMGIIYTGDGNTSLQELTFSRSVSALPFGGRYRVIDFALSSMVNSGIHEIGLITQHNYHSLMDHLDSGKQWDLDRKRGGLFILPPYASHDNIGWYAGEIDAYHSNMSFIRMSKKKYVVLSNGNMVCNLTYDSALEFHKENNADITLIYKEEKGASKEHLSKNVLLQTDENNRICDIEVMPTNPMSDKVFIGMCIIENQLFQYLIEECVARGQHDFIKDILIKKMNSLKIIGFPYGGYLAKIDSTESYFRHNIELLNRENFNELFNRYGKIYTKVKDEVPAKYGTSANVENSLVADGCIIDGYVENCILFRGVKISKGAVVKNSIIMQDSIINERAIIENTILDKEVVVGRGKRLMGQESYPIVIRKRTIM